MRNGIFLLSFLSIFCRFLLESSQTKKNSAPRAKFCWAENILKEKIHAQNICITVVTTRFSNPSALMSAYCNVELILS